jgi:hypothetical protein
LQKWILLPEFRHQPIDLIAIKSGDLPDFLVAEAGLSTAGSFHEDAQDASLCGFPIHSSADFALPVAGQTFVQLRMQAPVGPTTVPPPPLAMHTAM